MKLFENVGGNNFKLTEVNGVVDDFGKVQHAVGAPGSLARVRVEYPKHIEILAKLFSKVTSRMEQDNIIQAAREEAKKMSGSSPSITTEAAGKVDKLSASERNKLHDAFKKAGLDGNGRFEKKEQGLAAVTNALASLGFQLDMVPADIIMGDKGSRNFVFRRVNAPGQDVFTEQPEITNSRIVFTWERLDGRIQQYPNSPSKFEILVYAS